MEGSIKPLKKSPNYKWVILATCFMMEFVCLGFCSSNPGLYTTAVTEALNIPRSLYAIGTSIRYVVQVVVAFFFGSLIQRFGHKKLVALGLFSLCASMLARCYAANVVHHYIGCVLWGFGIVLSGGTMASAIVRQWFQEDIGKYTGIVMSANGIGGAIAAQIISPIINNGETFGYRKAYLLSVAISLVISIAILLLLKNNSASTAVAGTGKKKARGQMWVGIEFSEAKRKPYFYLIFALIFLTGISLQSVGSISIVYLQDLGFEAGFVATTATVSSLVLTVAKISTGFTYDKKGLRFTLLMCQICVVIGFLLKATLKCSPLGMVLAMTATVLTTIAMPLETVMIPLISNDLFGTASYSKVLGIFMAANSLGLCLGSPLCDIYRDLSGGSYVSCYWFFAGLMFVVIVGFQLVITAANKEKVKVLAATAYTE
ncbi:MAG: MFS transporter [Oscillospiraceae bacterium]|nr:MFS transporter [Oscillospiraceae bacterium]